MKKFLIGFITVLFFTASVVSASSLFNYYRETRGYIPSVSQRAVEYRAVVGNGEKYKNTEKQNEELFKALTKQEPKEPVLGSTLTSGFFVTKNLNASSSQAASSSPTYMHYGYATTTLSIDAYANGGNTPLNSLSLAVQLTATTGVPTINIACERSQNGIDWYRGNCYDTGTTTKTANLIELSSYTWWFASSTCAVGGARFTTNQSICTRIFEIEPLTRFTRAIFSAASTTQVSAATSTGAIWAEFIGKK